MRDEGFLPLELCWRLAPGMAATLTDSGDADITVEDRGSLTIRPSHKGLARALVALGTGASEATLYELAGPSEIARLHYYITRLMKRGLLEASVEFEGRTLVCLLPRHPAFDLPRPQPEPKLACLDRFAFMRATGRGALLQLPDASCDILARDPDAFSLVARLASAPFAPGEIGRPHDRGLLRLFLALGFAVDPETAESEARRTWEFHDRLFHFAARSFDDFIRRGGTYRFHQTLPAPPAVRPAHRGDDIPLPAPAPSALTRSRPLWSVMEERRSRREMSDVPVGMGEIGELLYRIARVTEVLSGREIGQDCLLRPFPSGGAIHELEFYLAIDACNELAPGFYHYRSDAHALTRLPGGEDPARAMLEDCALAWAQPGCPPHVLVVIASRLPRLAWKYEGIAYRVSLLNAGIALQSLYLITTDMGLAGSAVGSANPTLFADATGIDMFEETSIAEFGFGRPA